MMAIYLILYGGVFMTALHVALVKTNNEFKNVEGRRSFFFDSINILIKWRNWIWTYMIILTLIAWTTVFISEQTFELISREDFKLAFIFYGFWIGLIHPVDSHHISFNSCIFGYLLLLAMLVIEKKLLNFLDKRMKDKVTP